MSQAHQDNSGEKTASVIAAADEFKREAAPVMLMVAVVVGVVAVGHWSFPALWQQAGDRPVEFAFAAPRLLVQPSRATSGEPAFLGLILQGRANDAVVMIRGLVPGMSLSSGSAVGANAWQVPATDLPHTWIGPPSNFVGVVDLVAELHLADMTIADRRPLKLEWGAAIPATAGASPTVETDRTAVAPPREQTVALQLQLGIDESTVETDQTAVAPPQEQDVAPSRQDADESTVETHRIAIAPPGEQNVAPSPQLDADEPTVETARTAVASPGEQNVAPSPQLDADEPTVETARTAVASPGEQNVAPSPQLDADEPTVETARTAVASPGEQNVAPSPQLDADELAALLKRGEDLIRSGDLAAARLVLQRAAEANSAEAALTLAATYDPVILRKLRVYGFASDVGMARSWYEKAKEFGSAAASQRLEILANAALGMVDLIAELQLADATVIHRQPIQMEWIATSPAVAAQVPAVTPITEAVAAPRQLEQDETAIVSSENPAASIKQHGGRTHQKPVASKVTALPAKAKVPQQASNERSPEHMRQSQCDYRGCASAYRSFRASDCTYQSYGGQRRLCEKGARPTDVRERASQVSTQTRAQQCNLDVCAQFYRSFDPSDCTYQPNSGGARKTCDR
jgi:BA14K-like protein